MSTVANPKTAVFSSETKDVWAFQGSADKTLLLEVMLLVDYARPIDILLFRKQLRALSKM